MIAACLIVKDDSEVRKLERALQSLIPYIPFVYVTANGKRCRQIKKLCQNLGVNYSWMKWEDDFSKIRNFNFSQVKEPVDYIFWMDTDDVLIGGEYLESVADQAKQNEKDVVFFTYWYGCTFSGEPSLETLHSIDLEQNRERLIKPGTNKWEGRLHETPVPVDGAKSNYTKYLYDSKERPIAIMHTASLEDSIDKMQRNKRILEIQLEEEKKRPQGADPRTLLYLMKIYSEIATPELLEKTIEMGEEYLQKSGWNLERAAALEHMGISYVKLGKNQKAISCFHMAIQEWPFQPLIYLHLASCYYNEKNYAFCEYWMNKASEMNLDNQGSNMTNLKAMKVAFAELLLKLNYNARRDTKKALEAAKLLYTELPTEANLEQMNFIADVVDMNQACEHVDLLAKYLKDIGEERKIVPLLDTLPNAITVQPFAQKLRQKFSQPRTWGVNEICYFANFGGKHFEEWDDSSLKTGIGGSETAVIQLAREWSKLGYNVTIYGDPIKKGDIQEYTEDMLGQIVYLPWYYFNPKDTFNIFIQWRSAALADKVKAKKFFVDLHDIYAEIDLKEHVDQIDAIMVKSKYHRQLAPGIPDDKFRIVGNGI